MAFDQNSVSKINPAFQLAGQTPMGLFGGGDYKAFQDLFQNIPEKDRESFLQWSTINSLMKPSLMQMDPAYQERMLEMADKYQTRKGWKTAMFNTLGSGIENLTKGIAMSMNPYGTAEAARYAADMTAAAPQALANALQAGRREYQPTFAGVQAPTYF